MRTGAIALKTGFEFGGEPASGTFHPVSLVLALAVSWPLAFGLLNEPPSVARLVRLAASDARTIEPRLSGGFMWAPLHRGKISPNISAVASIAIAEGKADSSRSHAHVVGVAQLLKGNASAASQELAGAAQDLQSAAAWSDAAAAQYVLSIEKQSHADLLNALVAADSALAIAPRFAETRFNRALILERFGLRELAAAAWTDYLEVDSSSGWAVEARERLRRLSTLPEPFAEVLDHVYETVIANPSSAVSLAERYPLEVRIWGETEILARWAEATLKGDADSARRHRTVARAFADAIGARGEHLFGRMVRAVEHSSGDRARTLAQAHLDFRAAQKTFRALKPAEAELLFDRATRNFDRGGSPGALLARYFHANTIYEQGNISEALRRLDALLVAAASDSRAYRAQVQWERGLCLGALGRMGECIAAYTDAVSLFTALGERSYAAATRQLLANAYDNIGDPETAWELNAAALPEIGRVNSVRLQATLGSLATAAILRREWRAASSLLTLELDAARAQSSDVFLADALLRRALVHERLANPLNASSDYHAALAHVRRIEDSTVRSQYEARASWVGGAIAPTPTESVESITHAIASMGAGRRVLMPAMLFDRARAHDAMGDVASAAADLEEAIAELEAHRESLPRDEKRWGVFHDAEDIFDFAIDIALHRGHVAEAFAYSDRARARALLDELRLPQGARIAPVRPGTMLIEYCAAPDRLHLFVADESGIRHVSVNVPRTTLALEIASLHRAIEQRANDRARASLRRLYDWLVKPGGVIPANVTLAVVPDASVGRVPFPALLGPEGRFVVEDHAVIVAPSATGLTQFAARTSTTAPVHVLMVVSNAVKGWESLPETQRETRRIQRMYTHATTLAGSEATPRGFETSASEADVIHFSGHALASDVSAADTFLLLEADDGEAAPYDVRRIAKLRLPRSPIVVLAACSTARGRATSLEGTVSVAYAFVAAGSRDVIATLWPIDDSASASFFARVHQHLADGEPPERALRAVQIEGIRNGEPLSMWAAVQNLGY
jgi:CHAT domain-containing protein